MVAKIVIVANPTNADVTVNSKVATKRSVTKLTLDDVTIADWPGWITAGCALGPYTGIKFSQRQQAGYLLARLQMLYP